MRQQAPITPTELMAAHSQGKMTFLEYLAMLVELRQRYEPRPDCIDWMAEEGQA